MKKQPQIFDDVLEALKAAEKKQGNFVCIGDAEERRATDAYIARIRAGGKIIRTATKWMQGGWLIDDKFKLVEAIMEAWHLDPARDALVARRRFEKP